MPSAANPFRVGTIRGNVKMHVEGLHLVKKNLCKFHDLSVHVCIHFLSDPETLVFEKQRNQKNIWLNIA